MTLPKIAILGTGRAGGAIFHALVEAGTPPHLLWTRSPATAEAARHDGVHVVSNAALPDLSGCELLLLAVSDGAVASLAQQLRASASAPEGAIVAHLSGALDLTPLDPLRSAGIETGSLHPLLSIAHRRTNLRGASAAVAGTSPRAEQVLTDIARQLGMHVIRPHGDRARYHAAACIVGNFPQVLLEAATRLLIDSGLTREDSQRALGPLLQSAARNAVDLGPSKGLTGPISRGDVEVVRRHLAALDASPAEADVAALYRTAGTIATELARDRAAPHLDEIEELLNRDP